MIIRFFSFILLMWCIPLIYLHILNHPCIPRDKPWLWWMIFLKCCKIGLAVLYREFFHPHSRWDDASAPWLGIKKKKKKVLEPTKLLVWGSESGRSALCWFHWSECAPYLFFRWANSLAEILLGYCRYELSLPRSMCCLLQFLSPFSIPVRSPVVKTCRFPCNSQSERTE